MLGLTFNKQIKKSCYPTTGDAFDVGTDSVYNNTVERITQVSDNTGLTVFT